MDGWMAWTDDEVQKHFKSQLEKQCLHHTPPGLTAGCQTYLLSPGHSSGHL